MLICLKHESTSKIQSTPITDYCILYTYKMPQVINTRGHISQQLLYKGTYESSALMIHGYFFITLICSGFLSGITVIIQRKENLRKELFQRDWLPYSKKSKRLPYSSWSLTHLWLRYHISFCNRLMTVMALNCNL